MRRDTTIINPRQLYIELGVDELKKLNCPQLGISHFYEFSLGQGKTHELKAVPDGSIDLLFNIGSDKVTTYISGTVFSVKTGTWEMRICVSASDFSRDREFFRRT